jgi:predicted nucleic acid-binding Zn ribbon protein
LIEIKIIQNYEIKNKNIQATNAKIVWEKHPSRIHQNNMRICTLCNSPTPEGEIKRWGNCSFCWRKINN